MPGGALSPAEHQETQDHQHQESECAARLSPEAPLAHRALARGAGTAASTVACTQLSARGSGRGAGPCSGRPGDRSLSCPARRRSLVEAFGPAPRAADLA